LGKAAEISAADKSNISGSGVKFAIIPQFFPLTQSVEAERLQFPPYIAIGCIFGAKLDRSLEMVDGKIKEIHDYHKRVRAAVADSAPVAEAAH
jgi:hypothetical protein